ncbi:MAG: hypothetical protein RLZZ165_698 [Bacteroidota bacterium]
MHRARYLDHFLQSLGKWSGGDSEVLLQMDRYAPDPLYRLIRGDYVKIVNGEVRLTEFRLTEFLEHDAFLEHRGGCTVEVRPFAWNQCIVKVLCERFDRQALEAWAMDWLDTEDAKSKDGDGLRNVIHYLSPPSYPLGKLAFSIDLGTAPVKALMELIRLLQVEKGTTRVSISGFWDGGS